MKRGVVIVWLLIGIIVELSIALLSNLVWIGTAAYKFVKNKG